MTANQQLYDRDFYAWANQQAELLRAGRLSEADIQNLAEEIESLGKSEKRGLISRLTVLLVHLLKWRYQAMRRGKSWRLTMMHQRNKLADHLTDNPSLRAGIEELLRVAYRDATVDAARETQFDPDEFPAACSWSIEQVLDRNFLPEVTN